MSSIDSVSGYSSLFSSEILNNLKRSSSSEESEKPTAAETASMLINNNDTDGDGNLSVDELGFSDELYEAMDTDGDGLLTEEELSAGVTNNQEQFDQELMAKMAEEGMAPPPMSQAGAASAYQEQYDLTSTLLDSVFGDSSSAANYLDISDYADYVLDLSI
ncbi:MAG: hypothetical protein AB7D07_02505 [Desulfovibrionaceae bacterium]